MDTACVEALRRSTPGCQRVLHLDNAGMALPSAATLERVKRHLDDEALTGGYRAADAARAELEQVYVRAATLLGGHPDEVAIVDSATRAWETVVSGLDWAEGDEVLVGANEYGSNMIQLLTLVDVHGIVVRVMPTDDTGRVDIGALPALFGERTRLVALTHVGTHSGVVQPAAAVGVIAEAHGVPLLLDACQSVGQLPIDVAEIGCTMLAATGRKYLRAPRGTGLLWVRRDWLDRVRPPVIDARGATWSATEQIAPREDARRFELWERSVAGVLGLGVALEELLAHGIEPISQRIAAVADELRAALAASGLVSLPDRGSPLCGIVPMVLPDRTPAEARLRLRAAGVNVSVSSVEMTRMDMERRQLDSVLRASVHAYNTSAEVQRFVEHLRRLSARSPRGARGPRR